MAAAGESECPILQGKSAPDEARPLAPLRSAVEQFLFAVNQLPEPARTDLVDRVRMAARPVASLIRRLSPALADLVDAPESPEEGSPEEDLQEQFAAAVATFLTGLARATGGAIVHLDDVQWLDAGTRRVLRSLVQDLTEAPLLVVVTTRDDDESQSSVKAFSTEFERVIDTRVDLLPLDDQTAGELLATHLGGAVVAPALTARLTARCGGNPFALGEYLRAVVDAGLIRPSWGGWVLEQEGLDALKLPADVSGLILAGRAGC